MKKRICFIFLLTLVSSTAILNAQNVITGQVNDQNNTPLSGVIVTQEGKSTGTRTDSIGIYKISVEKGAHYLTYSFPGMQEFEAPINGRSRIDVVLKQSKQEIAYDKSVRLAPLGRKMQKTTLNTMRLEYHQSNPHLQSSPNYNTESYATIHENDFHNALTEPQSTFSIDVDNASYSNVRRYINMGQLPPKDAVRTEELINYFNYSYALPSSEETIKITTEYTVCPWNKQHDLVLIALQGKQIETRDLPPANIVFLIDVSGSMQAANKLPLIKSSLRMLTNELRPCDKVAIVVYAGKSGIVLESTPGSNKKIITEAINQLKAGGATAGGAGLQLAYKVASQNFIQGGNNRIVLASDGDFNVGESSDAAMERLVEQQRDNGIFLTVTGFGMGNIKDSKLEQMADNGNGNYAYIDNSQEAKKVFIEEFGATLFTIAKDVKLQIEFNPEKVKAYRLVGYENRELNNQDFNNDRKDAGEMGAGQQVTAMYEIVPIHSDEKFPADEPLIYQKRKIQEQKSNELLSLKMRYKNITDSTSQLTQLRIKDKKTDLSKTSDNLRFAAAIAQYGMLLRESEYLGSSTYKNTIKLATTTLSDDTSGYRSEFIWLLKTTQALEIK